MIASIQNADISNKTVLLRVDFNVPIDENGKITDAKRIRETLPTINYLLSKNAKIVIMSHFGRPKGTKNVKYSLKPVADYISTIIAVPTIFINDCIGEQVQKAIADSPSGSITILENVRFYKEEEENDTGFAEQLSKNGDVYINDAFGAAHRAHASTVGIAAFFPNNRFAGILMEKELTILKLVLENPKKPFVAVIGGSKISGKIDVIENLLQQCDSIIVGGGMMFTFLRSMGYNTGTSLVEEDKIELASELIQKAKDNNVSLVLPLDVRTNSEFSNNRTAEIYDCTSIPEGQMGLDIGPKTEKLFSSIIKEAGTVLWNGPMGVFEFSHYEYGTKSIAEAIVLATKNGALTVIGGGDSAAAIHKFGLEKEVTHVSTGGGATLEYLEGKELPGVAALSD